MTLLPGQTLKTAARSIASLQGRAWLPPALLLLALSSIFLFDNDKRSYFKLTVLEHSHDQVSAKNMAIAENLSFEHRLLMFTSHTIDSDGNPTYDAYNRFPIGSFALIKLAILPFGNDLLAKIYAARTLMLLFFIAAALLAYLSLRRLASSRWIALTATLTAFSSTYCLHYKDIISGEVVVDLFAVLLVFHGMVVFEQEGRFRQLPIKACIALLLGWHVYALLLPFIVFGLMRELIKTRSAASTPPPPPLCQLKRTTLSLLRNRYLTLGVVALLFGISMLTINFTNEYFALNREIPPTELPSFKSMTLRTGFNTGRLSRSLTWSWTEFQKLQFHRVGIMFLPYAFTPASVSWIKVVGEAPLLPLPIYVLGIAVSGASLIGLLFIRGHIICWTTLTLSGFCWALPMRYTTGHPNHNFEAVFYIGVTLTLFSLVLLLLRRLSGERLIAALSVAALLAFAFSALRMSQLNNPNETVEVSEATVAEFESIRSMTDGNPILPYDMPTRYQETGIIFYYLSGMPVLKDGIASPARPDALVVSGVRLDGLESLTPQNQIVFLYESDAYHRHIDKALIERAGELIIRSNFDIYLTENALMYVKDPCLGDDISERFFLALHPADENNLPESRKPHGFDNLNFRFENQAVRRGERCIAIAPLPDYDVDRISTGQYTLQANGSTKHLWKGEFNLPNRLTDDQLKQINETIAQAGTPIIRSDFDVYLNDNALIYVKDNCALISDTKAPFFLGLFPVDETDLPDEARQYGFENHDFGFPESGFYGNDDRCIAIAPLPEYNIARIHTGQYTQRADGSTKHLWEGEIHLTQ